MIGTFFGRGKLPHNDRQIFGDLLSSSNVLLIVSDVFVSNGNSSTHTDADHRGTAEVKCPQNMLERKVDHESRKKDSQMFTASAAKMSPTIQN